MPIRQTKTMLVGPICLFLFWCLTLDAMGHSTFLPHHVDDFSLQQRIDWRQTVVIATIVFVFALGLFIYLVISGLPNEDEQQFNQTDNSIENNNK